MSSRLERFCIDVTAAFIFGSAFVGSWAMLNGKLPFPIEWLQGTPFKSYVGPAAILAGAVGGSALLAWILMLRTHPLALPLAFVAGAIEVGWIVGELLVFGTRDQVMGVLQVVYFAAGAIVAGLAAHLWWRQFRETTPAGGAAAIERAP